MKPMTILVRYDSLDAIKPRDGRKINPYRNRLIGVNAGRDRILAEPVGFALYRLCPISV